MRRIDASDIAPILPKTLGPDSPGYAFALIDGEEVQTLCQGIASLEHRVKITPDTAFRIASVTKHFLALVAQICHNRGVINLDAPLGRYIGELGGIQANVSLRQALQNCSGIRDHLELAMMAGGGLDQPVSAAQSLEMIARQQQTNFPPGTNFLYSNSNFLLVTLAVERQTGLGLGDLMEEHLFRPNAMSATFYEPLHAAVIPNLASGYIDTEIGFTRGQFATELAGEGALVSTLNDLVRWYRYLRADPDGLVALIATPTTFENGTTGHYAMGLFNRAYLGSATRSHNGLWPGYRADLVRFDDLDAGAICLVNVNTADPTAMTRKVMCAVYPGQLSQRVAAPDPALFELLTDGSVYLNDDTLEMARFSADGDGLNIDIGGWAMTHEITGPSRVDFSLPTDYLSLDWSEVAAGRVILKRINGDKVILQKVSESDIPTNAAHLEGVFTCPDLPSTLTISNQDGTFVAELRGGFAHRGDWCVTQVTVDIFMLTDDSGPWPRQLTAQRIDGGRALRLSGARVKNMRFDSAHAIAKRQRAMRNKDSYQR